MAREDTVFVFTGRGLTQLLEEGGSQSWALDPTRAKKCTWLVCTQNRHNPDPEKFRDPDAPHGAAFLIGRISGVSKSLEENPTTRWKIEISEYARIPELPVMWGGWRNPVRYMDLGSLGIQPEKLVFHPMPSRANGRAAQTASASELKLTIVDAKRGLAANYGVPESGVEITIRG
jgi:hypothetical protein